MEQVFSTIKIITNGEELINITPHLKDFLRHNKLSSGMLIISCLHTSCSLIVNENADPAVLYDLKKYMQSIVPYNTYRSLAIDNEEVNYKHFQEGEDDMPLTLRLP